MNGASFEASASGESPSTATRLWRVRVPETMEMARRGTWSVFARYARSASFAASSTGAAAVRTTSAPSLTPAIPVRPARGITRTAMTAPRSDGAIFTSLRLSLGPGLGGFLVFGLGRVGLLPRPVQKDLLFALALLLCAHELERVAQRRDHRFERRGRFAAP